MAYSYPISNEIKNYAKNNPRFRESLKMLNDADYITMNTVILTYPDTLPDGSQVIGVFYGHKANLKEGKGKLFKQDYIIRYPDKSFTSVTCTDKPSKQVMPIKQFKNKVGAGKHYGTDSGKLDHWYYGVDELPDILREEAQKLLDELRSS